VEEIEDDLPMHESRIESIRTWRPIRITSCGYPIFPSLMSGFTWAKIQKEDKRKIFSHSQKDFIAKVNGRREHTVLTRGLIAHAKRRKRNLFMVQIDFTNALGSIPQNLIKYHMNGMGIHST
jgi:hypothetical protein